MSRGLYRGQPCYACSIAFIFVGIIATFVIAYFIKREQRKKKDLNMNSKILISGACDGIGKELARLFARDYKCNIIVLDNNEKHSKDLLSQIKIQGGQGHFYKCDFKDRNMVLRTVAQITVDFGSIDIFVNTGGITLEKSFEDYCHEEILAIMEANFFGPTILTKEILPVMKARGKGHIVNVPSNLEIFDSQDILAYCGTKTAFSKVLQGLQAELKLSKSNIKITVAKPLFAVSEKQARRQPRVDQNLLSYSVRLYAEKVFKGIIYEDEEI